MFAYVLLHTPAPFSDLAWAPVNAVWEGNNVLDGGR
jgi:hypothetical protein